MKKVKNDKAEPFETLPDVLNVHQVRAVLGISRVGVYKLIDANKISCFKIGNAYKIPKTALIEYINQSCKYEKGGDK
jgi:excisionase family DNA binding protein